MHGVTLLLETVLSNADDGVCLGIILAGIVVSEEVEVL